jgi:membrane protein YdbS with pleckstrin-like domain
VNELFAPPGTDWQPVSPALARLRHAVLLVSGVVVVVILLVATLLFSLPWEVWLPVVVVVGGLLVWGWVLVDRNARSWGYAEREEDLYVKRGALFRRLVVVPYGRMQYVDVQAGPLEQAFKVASVHLHTASPGTSARIPGLPAAEAARLRDRLTALGQSQAAGL